MIDPTKTSPEKLAEMNDSLITDNNYLRQRLAGDQPVPTYRVNVGFATSIEDKATGVTYQVTRICHHESGRVMGFIVGREDAYRIVECLNC